MNTMMPFSYRKLSPIFSRLILCMIFVGISNLAQAKITNVNGIEIEVIMEHRDVNLQAADEVIETSPVVPETVTTKPAQIEATPQAVTPSQVKQDATIALPYSSETFTEQQIDQAPVITVDDAISVQAISIAEPDLWVRIRDGFSMPNLYSDRTSKYEQWYGNRPDYVERMLTRSQKYLFHVVEEVEKRGMPLEIALLPMIESGYNPQAYSRSHAAGIWQFIPATGRHYGLKQNYWADHRRNVTAATDAALNYLEKLHDMFGAWDLALAAYNAGEGTVSRAIERNHYEGLPADYQSLRLPKETKDYVPKLQAVKNIVFEPHRFGVSLVNIPNQAYFTRVLAPKQIDAKLAIKLAEISKSEFKALNPSYKRPVIVSHNSREQELLLPTWAADTFRANLASYDKPLTSWRPYKASRGERISKIAKKFNTSAHNIRQANSLSKGHSIYVSRAILVPNQSAKEHNLIRTHFKTVSPSSKSKRAQAKRTIKYKVKKGDTVSRIAKKFGVSIKQISRTNKLKRNKIKVGQKLLIKKNTRIKKRSKRRLKVAKAGKRGKSQKRHSKRSNRKKSARM